MAPATGDTIPRRVLQQATERPSSIAYQNKVDAHWQPTTWRVYAEQIRTTARAFMALGMPRGGTVAILGFNRPEWAIADHAAMMAGGAPAGIYTTCSPDEVQYIIHHSGATIAVVENAAQLAKLEAKRAQLPDLRWIVMMRGATPPSGSADVIGWDELTARAQATSDAELDARIDQLAADALATLIYTSGTTGPPKGVMLSHDNLAWTARALADLGGSHAGDVSLSYLPLSHIAEQMASLHVPATTGGCVSFAESIDKVADNLKEVRPTSFFGVPRIWEKFHSAVAGKLAEQTGTKGKLVAWARATATAASDRRDRGAPLGPVLAAQYALANRLVLGKLKAAIGFDRARLLYSGAAPIAPDVLAFFASLDLPVLEIYGQSEDSGPTSTNLPGQTRRGTVGPPLPGIEVKLGDDGEIMIRGRNVFLGYFKDPEATAAALQDGWLGSGDLGAFDTDGFLTITGRKKEIIITAGGKNIAPKNIEAGIKGCPVVSEVVVIGDRRKFLTALITLDEAAAKKLAPGAASIATAPEVRAAIQATVDEVNATLARVEQIKKFAILPRQFGIDTGELTPTLKIKRGAVAKTFAAEIDALYAGAGAGE